MSLDTLFTDEAPQQEPAPAHAVAEEAQQQTVPAQSQSAAPVTGEVPAQADTGASPGATTEQPKTVPLPALLAERSTAKERQRNLEAEIDELKKQLARHHAPPPVQAPDPDDVEITEEAFYKDPVGALKLIERRTAKARERERFTTSEYLARQQFADFDDVLQAYVEIAKVTPGLAAEVNRSPSPAHTMYQATKRFQQAQRAVDPSQIDAEVERRVQERLAQSQVQSAALSVPKPITSARGTGAATPASPAAFRVPSLDDILKPSARR